MRITPNSKYDGLPCSYVGVGCAYEDIFNKPFEEDIPEGIKSDGYLSLENANKFIRKCLNVRKKKYFKGDERMTLAQFLETNEDKCCVCVYGHFIYVNSKDYWSFFNNERTEVVCVWYLKDVHQ